MSFKVLLSPKSDNFLKKLDTNEQERIKNKFRNLANNPELGKPLIGKLVGLWSLRIGDYRAIYQIRKLELLILVVKIGHRKNVYEL